MIADIYGNVIQIGDYINYPVRYSSSMWMSTAKVLEVMENKLKIAVSVEHWDTKIKAKVRKTKITYVSNICNVTVLPKSYIHRAKFKHLTRLNKEGK